MFDAIYVINLPHRKDRRSEMQEQLSLIGLSLEVSPVRLFEAVRPTEAGPFPTIGARGCFLSHLGVLEHAMAQRAENVLILEDDCNFTKSCMHRLTMVAQSDWDILYGGTLTEWAQGAAEHGFVVVPTAVPLMGAHFIALRGHVLPGLIAYLRAMLDRPAGDPRGGPMHVDGAYSWFRREHPSLCTLLAVPPIAIQRSSRTDIHPNKWFDRWPGISQLVAMLRKIRNRR